MAKIVRVVAKRSDGQVFSYENADWRIISIEGIDFPTMEVFTKERGFGNGDIITGKRKGSRDVDIVARSQNSATNEYDRTMALAFHNANHVYDLEFTYMGNTRIAKNCVITGAKCEAETVYRNQEITVSFKAPDADLYADLQTQTNFVATTPLWHVTRAYPLGGSLPFDSMEKAIIKTVNYLGSEPAPIIATLKAKGLVNGVIARVGTGTITVDVQLTSGDTIVIDAENKLVTLNGERVSESLYNYLDLPSLALQYGDNDVQVSAEDENNLAFDARMDYTGRYGGL